MSRIYKIGTRASPLALRQVEEVLGILREFYPALQAEIVCIDTYGDRDATTPISEIEGTDFFTKEIDEALLRAEIDPSTTLRVNGERPFDKLRVVPSEVEGQSRTIDFAVHSAKDLPDRLPGGLTVAARTASIDPDDVLVSESGLKLNQLPYQAKIGTSSGRRKQGLKRYRGDFRIVDIRGNIEERLRKLETTDLDAIVVAAAGLRRLGFRERITQRLAFEIIQPHPWQGSLALVARKEDADLIELLSIVDSPRPCLQGRGEGEKVLI